MKKLSIGIQYFDQLREKECVYVDKTEQIHRLINTGTFIFLARPRRFGKSLLVSIIQQIFLGNRHLFAGTWIFDKIDWQPRPVLAINFNDLNYLSKSLEEALDEHMDVLAGRHQLSLRATDYKGKFQELIERLSVEKQLVLLVDEYDKAITDLLEDQEAVTEHVETLRNFYAVIKATAANHIHWAFFTGVSQYGKLSLFSTLNNLIDITLDARFATLVGYTQEELEHYFAEWIDALAEKFKVSRQEILDAARRWYNGFSWDGEHTVYVPYSTMLFLELQSFANHWFATATPSFLLQLFRQYQLPAYVLERLSADNTMLDNADVNHINLISLLFQTGYLTVKHVRRSLQGDSYDLGYPNYEVAQAFQKYLLADYLNTNSSEISLYLLKDLEQALNQQEIQRFVLILNSVFAGIPHTLFLPDEAYYHSIIYLVLKLLGFSILAEPLTSQGRIDAVLELPDTIYILEFKLSSAKAALSQIKKPYLASGKQIILIGIAFNKNKRAIGSWQSE